MIKSIRDILTQPIDTSATTLSRDDLMSVCSSVINFLMPIRVIFTSCRISDARDVCPQSGMGARNG